ncbi:MAG: GNAT family N-acetyltransferase [Oscillospiraceae bacterium]
MPTIRLARGEDLDAVWALVSRAMEDMHRRGNPQWSDGYPTREIFGDAIADGDLYLQTLADGTILGCAVLNSIEEEEHQTVRWSVPGPAMVLHKMAFDPAYQHQGGGSAFFAYAEELARQRGLKSLRMNTFSKNDRMQALVSKLGFSHVGDVHFGRLSLPYPCYEKVLF